MSSISRISYFHTLIALFFMLWIPVVGAMLPSTMSYQAYVTDATGSPVGGEQSVTFRLYTTQNGASMVWQETQQLTLHQGLLRAQLGAVMPLDLPDDFDTPLFLGIELGADGEMSPRQPLAISGYAVQAANADTLDGQDAAALDQSAHVSDTSNPHGVSAIQIGAATLTDIGEHAALSDEHHARYTNAEAIAAVQSHDGAGVNADTLDGNHAAAFAPVAHGHNHHHDTSYYTQPQVDTIVSALQGRIVEAERCPEATFLVGFDEAGKVLCSETNPVCGSGKIIDPEQCDDGNLSGGDGCSRQCEVEREYFCFGAPSRCMRTTEMWAQAASALVITELNFGPSTITEYNYQWIELKNTSDRLAFNLQDGGFAVEYTDSAGRPQTKEFSITAPLVVLPGQSVVLSEAPAAPEATGLAVSFVWGITSSSFYLPATQEGSVRLTLVDPFGQKLDGIEYVGSAPLLDRNSSIALDPDFYNNGQNDEVAPPGWCGSSSIYGSKEVFYRGVDGIGNELQRKVRRFYGSPGSDNAQCP